jgi:nitrate/nitrite transporter NarK
MDKSKAVIASSLAAIFLAASLSSASARWYHHRGPGPVLGILGAAGAVVTGAAIIATAPLRIIAGAGSPPPPRFYDAPPGYGPPPPRYYRYAPGYGPPPGYYGY